MTAWRLEAEPNPVNPVSPSFVPKLSGDLPATTTATTNRLESESLQALVDLEARQNHLGSEIFEVSIYVSTETLKLPITLMDLYCDGV